MKAPNTKRIAALEALQKIAASKKAPKAASSSGRIAASLKAHAKALETHAKAARH